MLGTTHCWASKKTCLLTGKFCAGVLNRIKDNIPSHLHKGLYHTLFESYLSYGISVWGGVSQTILAPLFKAQKQCCRIMFGDKEAYLDKFKTCARTRVYGNQRLDSEFYTREHCKPLLNKHLILNIHSLYTYFCAVELFKVLKFRSPISLYSQFQLSPCKETLLITTRPSHDYVYRSGLIWNIVRKRLKILEFASKFGPFKLNLKNHLLTRQRLGDREEWESSNFVL